MTRMTKLAALLALLAVAVAAVGTSIGSGKSTASSPIVLGWALDVKGRMAPFDGPALAAATIRIKQINARGGVNGRPLQLKTCDTQDNNPAKAKSCAASLLGQGAKIMFVTCDVDFATPVVQESINRGVLAVAPCIGTDQMGPKRFGTKGRLAFSFGNAAQDEGSAMAEYAYRKGWRVGRARDEHAARLLQERRHRVRQAVHAARRQDRRPRELRDRRQQRQRRGQPPEREEGRRDRHVDRVRRAACDSSPGSARSGTRPRSSTRGPVTARTGTRRTRR